MAEIFRHRRAIERRPRKIGGGQIFRIVSSSSAQKGAEDVLVVSFMSNRKLFGLAYWEVQPDYFDQMPKNSGVFIAPLVRTRDILRHAERPGDIDLLVIPYEEDELVLDRILAIEAKAVRARYLRQNKSPNEFGFSQASSLLELGFPYVAVAHLIVSDLSPEAEWQETMAAEVLDRDGNVRSIGKVRVDPMPERLTDRTFGRLQKNRTVAEIGLISAYLFWPVFGNADEKQNMLHLPSGQPARWNPKTRIETLDMVATYFQERYADFLDTPRFDPV